MAPPKLTPKALHALVSKIPAKTLHAYVLAHLPTAPPDTLTALASFFATLRLPTLLHCVRCHTDYTEVENDSRSCRVPHDESSAEAEWVGYSGRNDSEYESLYLCCGKTVDGEFYDTPLAGWCYEGMHTTDVKRACFRDDATSDDDMLESCVELNCVIGAPPRQPRATSSAGGVRPMPPPAPPVDLADSDDDDDNASGYTEDSPVVVEIARSVGAMKQKSVGPRRTKATARKTTGTLVRVRGPIDASRGTSGAESSKTGKVRAPPASASTVRTPVPAEGKVRKRRKVAGAA
ncbi:hypothetical protein EDB85DRAFT_2024062 [Lactarius pseudohatsudake]|nr:hypothetical protein EDB85DRAFT_2024062 [Lactarius pseudohatsudake]